MSVRVAVVVPAAGLGRRMGGRDKPFLTLDGRPLLEHALRPFLAIEAVEWVRVAVRREVHEDPPAWLVDLDARVATVAGGTTRSRSVCNAVGAVPEAADVILVHDAARPLLSREVVERVIAAAGDGAGALAAVPARDTIKVVEEDVIIETPARERLWQAQTPQGFPREMLVEACARAAEDGFAATDDAALVEHYGARVRVVEGDAGNIKVTSPVDLAVARAILDWRRVNSPSSSEEV